MVILNGKEENPSSKNIDKPFNCDARKAQGQGNGHPQSWVLMHLNNKLKCSIEEFYSHFWQAKLSAIFDVQLSGLV